jgi:hypothetical protein
MRGVRLLVPATHVGCAGCLTLILLDFRIASCAPAGRSLDMDRNGRKLGTDKPFGYRRPGNRNRRREGALP